MRALADSYAFWILLFMVFVVVYLLPTLIAVIRGTDALALVILVNLIGAPTGIGWLAAMILAFGSRRLPPAPQAYAGGYWRTSRNLDAPPWDLH